MLDSGAEWSGFKSQPWHSIRQTVHTRRSSVHQAAKLVAALLRVARVTASLVEINGSLPPGLWLMSPADWLPRTGISSGTLCSMGYISESLYYTQCVCACACVCVCVCVQHIVFAVKFLVAAFIPDVPADVKLAIKRVRSIYLSLSHSLTRPAVALV